jgi:drug/metabolite transporter (DMT)-like permease
MTQSPSTAHPVHHRLRAKTVVLLVLMVLFGSTGDILLSAGMKKIGAVNDWSPAALAGVVFQTFTSGTVWLGISGLILFFVCYLLVLSWADYSFVLPATATSYVVVPLLGFLLLGEMVGPVRWAGVALIGVGVALVGLTPPSTTVAKVLAAHPAAEEEE